MVGIVSRAAPWLNSPALIMPMGKMGCDNNLAIVLASNPLAACPFRFQIDNFPIEQARCYDQAGKAKLPLLLILY